MKNLMDFAKTLDKAFFAMRIILISFSTVAAAAFIVGTIAAENLAEFAASHLSFTSGVLSLRLNGQQVSPENFRALLISLTVVLAVYLIMALCAIRLLRSIISEMKDGRPFTDNTPLRIRKFAGLIFVYAFITPSLNQIPQYFYYKFFNLQQVLSGAPNISLANIRIIFNVDVVGIFVYLVVMLLSLVFEYGISLQQQADETL